MSVWFVVTGFDVVLQCGTVAAVIICFTWAVLESGPNPQLLLLLLLLLHLWKVVKIMDGDVQGVKILLRGYQLFTNAFVFYYIEL